MRRPAFDADAEHRRLKIIWSGIVSRLSRRSKTIARGWQRAVPRYLRPAWLTEEGGAWVYSGGSAIEDPDWLTVDAETEAAAKSDFSSMRLLRSSEMS
jgi:hypothetical protein